MFEITAQRRGDKPAIEALLDAAFGPGRKAKTSYRFRNGVTPVPGLALAARDGDRLLGSITYYPVRFGGTGSAGLLLGPLAVDPALQGRGVGSTLMHQSLAMASMAGHGVVVLVGDPVYYSRFGFSVAGPHGIWMADENQARLQVRELIDGTLASSGGEICHWGTVRAAAAA